MASLKKLEIRGVRAFSPDGEPQCLRFQKPMTVIVGANGCGKTTIIECLKYAVTGTVPPNTTRGSSFVHDPKLCDQTEVAAQIRLQFTNRGGIPVAITRSMRVTQARGKLTFKAHDVNMKTVFDGESVALSHKCSEMDALVPQLLGANKAVLNDVVFCHQEDSLWPLQEGKVLKTKFDAIFESTRYSLALAAIKTEQKEQTTKQKLAKLELEHLKTHQSRANILEQEIAAGESYLASKEEQKGESFAKAEEINGRIEQLHEAYVEATETLSRVQRAEGVRTRTRGEWDTARDAVEEEFDEVGDALDAVIEEAQAKSDEATARLAQNESESTGLKDRAEELRAAMQRETESRGGLAARAEHGKKAKSEFAAKLADIHRQYDMFSSSIASVASGADSLGDDSLSQLADEVSRRKDACTELEQIQARDRSTLQQEVTDLQIQHDTSKKSVVGRKAELSSLVADKARLVREAKDIGDTRSLQRTLDTAISAVTAAKAEVESGAHATVMREGRERVSAIGARLNALKYELQDAVSQKEKKEAERSDWASLETKKNDLAERERETERQLERSRASLLALFDDDIPPLDTLDMRMQALCDERNDVQARARSAQQQKAERFTTESTKAKAAHTEYQKAHRKLTGLEEGAMLEMAQFISDVFADAAKEAGGDGGGDELDDSTASAAGGGGGGGAAVDITAASPKQKELLLRKNEAAETLATALRRNLETASTMKTMRAILKGQKKDGLQTHMCPLCTRAMDGDQESAFCGKIETLMKNDYKTIGREAKEAAKGLEAKTAQLTSYLDAWGEWKSVKASLEKLSSEHAKRKTRSDGAKSELDDAKMALDKATTEVKEAQRQYTEVVVISNMHTQAKTAKADLEHLEEQARASRGGEAGVSLDELKQTIMTLRRENDDLNAEREVKRGEISTVKDRVSSAQSRLSESKSRQSVAEGKLQQLKSVEKQLKSNDEKQAAAQRAVRELQSDVPTMKRQWVAAESKMKSKERDWKGELSDLRTMLSKAQRDLDDLKTKRKEITALRLTQLEAERAALDRRIEEARKNLKAAEKKLGKVEKLIQEDKEQISRNYVAGAQIAAWKRNLVAKAAYEEACEEYNEAKRLKRAMETTPEVLSEALRKAKRKKEKLIAKLAENDGAVKERKRQVQQNKVELSSSKELKNISKRFKRKNIEFETNKMAIKDLEAYYRALDTALHEFHKIKLDEINMRIKSLWHSAYKGHDIDGVSIASVAKKTGARGYNYSIMMSKADTEMPMRGRCSAGQKVLASFVIRLALADAFCTACGVLTLDEPTTNLDVANKEGLAQAIGRIIVERKAQKNFQLIVITHDEDFIQMLSDATEMSRGVGGVYWRISREEDAHRRGTYHSKIERQNFGM